MLAKHGAIYLVAKFFPALIALGLLAILTRNLSSQEYGYYSLTILTAGFINSVFLQWIILGVGRYLPDCKNVINEQALLNTARLTLFLVVMLLSPVFFLLYFFRETIGFSILFHLLGFVVFAQAWFDLNLKIINAQLRPIRYGIVLAVKSVLVFVTIYTLLRMSFGVEGVIWALITGLLFATIFSLETWKGVSWKKYDTSQLKKLWHYGFPLTGTFLFVFVIDASDRFFIDKMLGPDSLGTYSAAYDFTQYTIGTLLAVVHLAAFPIVMKAYTNQGLESAQKELKKIFVFVLLVLAPVTIGTMLVADNLAQVMLGQEFVEIASLIIPWVALAIFFSCIRSYYFDYAFQLASATKTLFATIAIAAVVNLVFNFVLIPVYGVLGAAMATVIAFLVALIMSIYFGRKIFSMPVLPWSDVIRIMLSVCVMALAVVVIKIDSVALELVLKITLGAIVYSIIIIGLNVLNTRNWLMSKKRGLA